MPPSESEGTQITARIERDLAALRKTLHAGTGFSPFETLFDEMFEGVQVIDFTWRYLYLNPAAVAHAQCAPGELLGARMMDAYPGIDRTPMFVRLERCMYERRRQRMVNEFVYPDGRRRWFDLRITPVSVGVLVFSVDITEEREVRAKLQAHERELATTLACMDEAVFVAGEDGKITDLNPAAEALCGWTCADAAGRTWTEVVRLRGPREGDADTHRLRRLLTRKGGVLRQYGLRLVTRTGEEVPVRGGGSPLVDADGDECGIVVLLQDSTEEDRLERLYLHSQKMEAVGQLAGGVAHDFNNLLMSILGYADLLERRLPSDDPGRAHLDWIRKSGERAEKLVRQLLAYGRRQVLHPVSLDLGTRIREMRGIIEPLIGEDVELRIRVDDPLPPIAGDPGQVEQVVMNLVVNARDAMPAGGSLTVTAVAVDLDQKFVAGNPGSRSGAYVRLSVADEGTGIPASIRDQIFEPYFTTKKAGHGTGLGLATLYGIVTQMEGFVLVSSREGEGTTFEVFFPQSGSGAHETSEPARREEGEPGGDEMILVVEDEDSVRQYLVSVLAAYGYEVLAAASGEDALATCDAHRGRIDLVITDMVMPGMNGQELARAIRERRPGISLLFMSGYSEMAVSEKGSLDPEVRFLEKPLRPRRLLNEVRQQLAVDRR